MGMITKKPPLHEGCGRRKENKRFTKYCLQKRLLIYIFVPQNNKEMARVSITDVAKKVGVAVSTVSLVLNDRGKERRVSDELSEKIRIEAKAMNYKPNVFAKGLRSGRSETIGLIISDISNPFFGNLAFHVQENAEKHGYSVLFTNTNEDADKMEKMISILKSRNVDGFIIVPTEHSEKLVEQLIRDNYPVVLLDRYFKGVDASHVVVNNYKASMEATNLLLNLKCKRIALIVYNDTLQTMKDRRRGYVDAMNNKGLYDPMLVKEVNFNTRADDVQRIMTELVSGGEMVDGIFFANSTLCINSLQTLTSLKLDISKDIKVACFDKSDYFKLINASIPCIKQPLPEMGKRAVELLIQHINQKDIPYANEELQANLEW
jgi:LacI family transcriptional regulator